MFKTKTVFVLGAGASVEVGLPTGEKLKPAIAKLLNFTFDFGQRKSGDTAIFQALHEAARSAASNDVNPWLSQARLISKNMASALSIDNYIDAHRNNSELELCGKLAIVRAILDAEAGSLLKQRDRGQSKYTAANLENTWFSSFFKKLHENVSRNDVETIMENISLVIFNYDRCFEHFLVQALEDYYAITSTESYQLVNDTMIVHPYGTVGPLPWQHGQGHVGFGDSEPRNLLALSAGIKTFTQGMRDDVERERLVNAINDAETIVFLGYSYQEQNMAILKPTQPKQHAKRILGTSMGISPQDTLLVKADLERLLTVNGNRYDGTIDLSATSCNDFFANYWRHIGTRF